MWLRLLIFVSLLSGSALAAADAGYAYSAQDVKSGKALDSLSQKAYSNVMNRMGQAKGATCSAKNIRVRKEWRTLAKKDKQSFIDAVKCVRAKPSLYPPGAVPGSKSLYDDFIAVHLNQTLFIHLTGTFLTWHRYYIFWYEKQLNLCGYPGSLPYWEWGLDVNKVEASPIFDGSPLSLGGNGKFIPHEGLMMPQPLPPTVISIPPGTGSGCVTTGPFGAPTVRLGPVAMPNYGNTNSTSVADPLGDNLRCLKRDLNSAVAAKYSSFYNSTSLILESADVENFQAIMQGDPRYVTGDLGVHGGGHFTIGGDPGSDPFISPGDPVFYLHHSQVDRLYWIWQNLDWPNRQNVFGTSTFLSFPPTTNVTLNDNIDLGVLTTPIPIKNLMDTIGGTPLCYVYQ
ncbi:Tyrosinase central domain-containing protein [Coniochaeta hoffmannii]|uniref:Tyrosinase central domain-containing protein n=1 Tax=Coniochaeta hoffmannii TaxID=91930 RepID=A0AA38RX46_9PEZI|nr:Tyrosinase central domain-containing protein [Coniochaeta hoffmannii]